MPSRQLPLQNGTFACLQKVIYEKGTPIALGAGVTASHKSGATQELVLTFTNAVVPITDAGASGAGGGLKIYSFPRGNIKVDNFTTNLTIARVGTNLTTTAAVVASLGTVAAAADATLTSTEADIVASTSATLTAGAGSFKARATASVYLDGTTTAKDVYLNFAVPDAGSAGNDSITVNGTITLQWNNGGYY